jgi:hypothetical protein
MRARIRIDRLVLDGLPAGTTLAGIERAVRAALAARLVDTAPARPAAVPELRLQGQAGSVERAAGDVAGALARHFGGGR